MILTLYKVLTILTGPLIDFYLRKRCERGKEDAERLPERKGFASITRPKGKLVWVHAASVGESMSVLPLIQAISLQYPSLNILLTTGTVSSAAIVKTRLPDRCYHQYVPVDHYFAVQRFLRYWRPDLALWVESEIWPNLLTKTQAYCPLMLLNGRLSENSLKKWLRYPVLARTLMRCFTVIFPQSEADAARFKQLGAPHVKTLGNLKYDAPALPADSKKMGELVSMVGDRFVFVAASTHPHEELMIAQVHAQLKLTLPDLLTIIIPRHSKRVQEIYSSIESDFPELQLAIRSRGEVIHDETDVYLVDTMGELGLFYRLAPVVFIGGSLVEHGGQNPLEAARLECAILFGPYMDNFKEIATELQAKGGAIKVTDITALQQSLLHLCADQEQQQNLSEAAQKLAINKMGILHTYMEALAPNLDYLQKQTR
jgi:3-deoxy-D-manno-octulosonic-acid transferase